MTNNFRQYAEHYSVLALIFAAAILALIIFRFDLQVEQVVVWGLSAMYVLWGIVHHALRRDLSGFIVLEYVMIGLLAGLVVTAVVVQK